MKERLPKIIEAKGAGLIGEGVDGFLHLRGKKEKTVVQLVTVENEDRKEFFKAYSIKTGSTTQEVALLSESTEEPKKRFAGFMLT